MTKTRKKEVVAKFREKPTDTGSTSVQVALLTERIQYLSEHLKLHRKDHHTQLGLLKLVGKRKRLLTYLKREGPSTYQKVIKQLELRK
ncbi:MAG: 30S ribosomal protein S15 [Elusimicrobia bacterium]|nr:30S ribosomal protein S15 [Elusimicrobiota bacterium]